MMFLLKINSLLKGVFIADTTSPEFPKIITSKEGVIYSNPKTLKIQLKLNNGTIHELNKERGNYQTLNFNRYDSSKISFYLSIPALTGASILGLKDIINQNLQFNILTIFAVFLSFFFSYLTIKYFLAFTKKFSLKIFVYYRIILAGLLFVIVYS